MTVGSISCLWCRYGGETVGFGFLFGGVGMMWQWVTGGVVQGPN